MLGNEIGRERGGEGEGGKVFLTPTKPTLHSSSGLRLHTRSSSSPNLRHIANAGAAAASNGGTSSPNSPPLLPSPSASPVPSPVPSSLLPSASPGILNFLSLSGLSLITNNNSGSSSPRSGSVSAESAPYADPVPTHGSIRLSVRYLVCSIFYKNYYYYCPFYGFPNCY